MSGVVERRGRRARGALVYLLLLVPLLLGVAAMHTFGHPHDPEPVSQAAVAGIHSTGHGPPAAVSGGDTHGGAELPPMDPMTMCLAVLGLAILLMGAVAAVLLRPGLRRRPPGADLRTVLRALPPPAPPSLATLQVMRV